VGGNQTEIAITGHPAAGGGVRVRYRLGLNLNPSHPGRGVQIQGRKNQKMAKENNKRGRVWRKQNKVPWDLICKFKRKQFETP